MLNLIQEQIQESTQVIQTVAKDAVICSQIEKIVNQGIKTLQAGGKIIFCGNGGSFADAQHLTAEFVSRLRFDRAPLASFALGTNSSCMSAIGNDYGYNQVFSRELLSIGTAKDMFIPISTSGNSENVLEAIKAANTMGIFTIGFTGLNGGKMSDICECIKAPSSRTERIQEVHIMMGHVICGLIEAKIFNK